MKSHLGKGTLGGEGVQQLSVSTVPHQNLWAETLVEREAAPAQ